MITKRLLQKYLYRIVTTCLCADVSFVKLICCLATILFFFAVFTNNSTTVLTSNKGIKLDVKDIEKEAINTIFIENANGNYYIAFEMPKGSATFRKIRNGIGVLEPIRDSDEQIRNSPGNDTQNSIRTQGIRNVSTPVFKVAMTGKAVAFYPTASPQYPLTVYPNPYYILNKDLCQTEGNLTFVVLVHSATGHFSRRIAIRETWANKKLFKTHEIRVVFLLGKPEKDSTQVLIEHEHSVYGDIVQGNFLDTYHNLTHKAVLGVRFVIEHCLNTKTVIKVDDDVFLNVFQLISNIEKKYLNASKSIFCGKRSVNTSRIERTGKWKVEDNYFRNLTFYPVQYCNGFFALMTADMFPALFEAAKQTPFFWIDDVYLFGLLTERIGGVKIEGLSNLNLNEKDAVKCFENSKTKCKLLVATARTEGVMDQLWYNAANHYKELAKRYSKNEFF